jgi:hypothetical protein
VQSKSKLFSVRILSGLEATESFTSNFQPRAEDHSTPNLLAQTCGRDFPDGVYDFADDVDGWLSIDKADMSRLTGLPKISWQ